MSEKWRAHSLTIFQWKIAMFAYVLIRFTERFWNPFILYRFFTRFTMRFWKNSFLAFFGQLIEVDLGKHGVMPSKIYFHSFSKWCTWILSKFDISAGFSLHAWHDGQLLKARPLLSLLGWLPLFPAHTRSSSNQIPSHRCFLRANVNLTFYFVFISICYPSHFFWLYPFSPVSPLLLHTLHLSYINLSTSDRGIGLRSWSE